jgi:hypothetical protein
VALVDPEISLRKLERELAAWESHAATFRRRGYGIVARDDLRVDVAFHARVPIGGPVPLPVVVACARIDFTNYDFWAPSVTFIDVMTGEPVLLELQAFDRRSRVRTPDGLPPNLIIDHPKRGQFLCYPGVREYHEHDEHDGDDWLLHRNEPFGTLDAICELLWRTIAETVVGFVPVVLQTPNGKIQRLAFMQGERQEHAA